MSKKLQAAKASLKEAKRDLGSIKKDQKTSAAAALADPCDVDAVKAAKADFANLLKAAKAVAKATEKVEALSDPNE